MANPVVVDSDLIIDYLRDRGQGADLVTELIRSKKLRVTAITAYELRVGNDFALRSDKISSLVRRRTVALDLRSAVLAGEIASVLTRAGAQIGMADSLQAGICMRHGLPLATRNCKHFERVEGLELYPLTA